MDLDPDNDWSGMAAQTAVKFPKVRQVPTNAVTIPGATFPVPYCCNGQHIATVDPDECVSPNRDDGTTGGLHEILVVSGKASDPRVFEDVKDAKFRMELLILGMIIDALVLNRDLP